MNDYLIANIMFVKFSTGFMELKKDPPIRPNEMEGLSVITKIPDPHTPVVLTELLGIPKPMAAAHLPLLMEKLLT